MNSISIFTDGSSRGNPGPGGWGSVVVQNDTVTELGGGEAHTTNNKMEITAAIKGLEHVGKNYKKDSESAQKIKIYTDSSYVINGITKWIHGWKINGWITKTKDEVMNKELWMKLDEILNTIGARNVSWEYVGGHIGIAGNERCDVIATSFADETPVELYSGSLSHYSIPNILDVSHDFVKAEIKKKSGNRSHIKAHSYVSSVGGVIEIHHSWAECEKRVKGAKGARYKKSTDAADEARIINEFRTK